MRWLACVCAGALSLVPVTAFAQAQDEATARALFGEARTLMKAGDYAHACPKLEAARALYTGSGVLLNLGDCYEHIGRTASAWTMFGEAVSAAQRANRADDEAEARNRQTAIAGKLTRIVVEVDRTHGELDVTRDGAALPEGAWGVAVPVDPGVHKVRAEAPGKRAWETTITANAPGKTVTVSVPALEAAPAPVAVTLVTPHVTTTTTSYWSTGRIAGVVTLGAGAVVLGVSGILGLVAKSEYDTAFAESGTARHNDSLAAVDLGNVATVFAVVGGVAAVAGVVIWLASPSKHVVVGSAGTSLFVRGTF